MKTCTKCYRALPLHAFDPHRSKDLRHRKRPVLQSWCRECRRADSRERMRRNRAAAKRQAQSSTKENST